MDIYKARNLQKLLFKSSDVDFKHASKFLSQDSTLYYVIYYKVGDYSERAMNHLTKNNATRLFNASRIDDVEVSIDILTKEKKELIQLNFPTGVYISEVIRVD